MKWLFFTSLIRIQIQMEPNTDLDPDPHCNVCTLYTVPVQLANLKLSDPQVVFTAADRHAQAGLVPLGQGCTILLFKIITTTITFRKFNSLPFLHGRQTLFIFRQNRRNTGNTKSQLSEDKKYEFSP